MAPDLEDAPAPEEVVAAVAPPWPDAAFPSSTLPAAAEGALPAAPLLPAPLPALPAAVVALAVAPAGVWDDVAEN